MRSEEFISQFGVTRLAAAGAGLNDTQIARRFHFEEHPTLKSWMMLKALQEPGVVAVIGRGDSYSHLRRCFYHCDMHSLYNRESVAFVAGHVKKFQAERKKLRRTAEQARTHFTGLPLPVGEAPTEQEMAHCCKSSLRCSMHRRSLTTTVFSCFLRPL
jgi:hypothetical protein